MRISRHHAALLFVLSILVSCSGMNQTTQDTVNRIVYGLSISVTGIDPHINQSSELGIVLRQVYDTLVYRDPETGDFVPGLAHSWDISDDGLNYTFFLRDDITFHDGTPFNADAVAANIQRITNPDTASQRARLLLGPLVSYQVVDEYTIRLTLSEPYAPLLDSLSQVYLGIASPAALAEHNNLTYQYHQVGTGPFEFVEYLPEDHITIRRNSNYAWGPEFYGEVPENAVEEIEYRFFRDPATRAAAVEGGQAQVIAEVLPLDARAMSGSSRVDITTVQIPGQPLQYYMNTEQFPTNELAVRQALLYGTNRTAIVDTVYQGFSPVAWGPLSRNALFYNPNVLGVYGYDVNQAASLLQNAGFADEDGDGILERGEQALTVRIIQPAWGLVPEVTQVLQDQWRSLGVEVIIDPVPGFAGLVEKVEEGDYNLVSFDSFGLDPAFINSYFLSNGENNMTGYSNVELDNALLQARRVTSEGERAQLYGQAQAIIMSQAIILPIRDYVNLVASDSRLRGLRFDPYGWFPLMHGTYLSEPLN